MVAPDELDRSGVYFSPRCDASSSRAHQYAVETTAVAHVCVCVCLSVCAYSAVSADNNPGCRDLQKESPHGPVRTQREKPQTTSRVAFHGTVRRTGRADGAGGLVCVWRGVCGVVVVVMVMWGGAGGVYDCAYFLRGPRAEALQQPAQDHPILQGALQERFGIRDGLLGRLQHPERDQPRNRLLRRIHVQSQQIGLEQEKNGEGEEEEEAAVFASFPPLRLLSQQLAAPVTLSSVRLRQERD